RRGAILAEDRVAMRFGIEAGSWTNPRGYGRFLRGLYGGLVRRGRPEWVLAMDDPAAREANLPADVPRHAIETGSAAGRGAPAPPPPLSRRDGPHEPRPVAREVRRAPLPFAPHLRPRSGCARAARPPRRHGRALSRARLRERARGAALALEDLGRRAAGAADPCR